MNTSLATSPYQRDENKVSFLDLPCEIRLRIYHLVYLCSPVRHQSVAPWYCIPTCRTYTVRAVVAEGAGDESGPSSVSSVSDVPDISHSSPGGLLSPSRLFCRIPTSLVRSCRQIYAEACAIPFRENEFTFINWFSLGLSSALAFIQGREEWQRAKLRYMRLGVFAQDLVPGSTKYADWVHLCGHLPGLWGLRVMMYMEGGGAYQTGRMGIGMAGAGTGAGSDKSIEDAQELVSERVQWIEEGLARLRELRQLEVELVDVKWAARDKVDWCDRLRELLEACNVATVVKVVCVERLG